MPNKDPTTVQRFDYIELNKQARVDENGFLYDSPVLTRTGVFSYQNADGTTRRELRTPEEVFKAESLASYIGKPITVTHPKNMVTAASARTLAIGTVLTAGRQDGDNVTADIVIHDAKAAGDKRELSLGYKLDLVPEIGEYKGQAYDHVQKNIRINHLAIVQRARAGSIARLNVDGDEEINNDKETKPTMSKLTLDNGIEYDAVPEVIAAFKDLKKKAETSEEEKDKEKKRGDGLEAERDQLKANAVAKEKERADAESRLPELVKARVSLLKTAETCHIDGADALTDRQIKEAVVKKARNDDKLVLTDRSDDYVQAAFDMACADLPKTVQDNNAANNRKFANNFDNKPGEVDKSSSAARQRMIENMRNDSVIKEAK